MHRSILSNIFSRFLLTKWGPALPMSNFLSPSEEYSVSHSRSSFPPWKYFYEAMKNLLEIWCRGQPAPVIAEVVFIFHLNGAWIGRRVWVKAVGGKCEINFNVDPLWNSYGYFVAKIVTSHPCATSQKYTVKKKKRKHCWFQLLIQSLIPDPIGMIIIQSNGQVLGTLKITCGWRHPTWRRPKSMKTASAKTRPNPTQMQQPRNC